MLGNIYWKNQDHKHMTDDAFSKHLKQMQKYEKVFWDTDKNDEINKKIDSAINICEDICNSANNFSLLDFIKNILR